MSQTQSPFSLLMRNALAGIKLGQASIDLRQKNESINGIVERGIRREIPERLQNPFSAGRFRHDPILARFPKRCRCPSLASRSQVFAFVRKCQSRRRAAPCSPRFERRHGQQANRDEIAASSSFANDQRKDAERDNTANYPPKIRSSCLDRRNLVWSAQLVLSR